jgi:hypothetical protein
MMHLQKHATYWRCESDIEVDGAHCAHVWEILDVNVPLDAKPYACLGNVIVFYNAAGQEIGRCRHFDLTVGNHLLFVGGRWWQVGAATVVQRDARWWISLSRSRRRRRRSASSPSAASGRATPRAGSPSSC